MEVALTVNGHSRSADVTATTTLVELLREHHGLTGTKVGCGHGECGACTVILDGEPVNSCLVFAVQCQGREVLTIEGLTDADPDGGSGTDEVRHPIQEAFVEVGAVQCGYCTPGMVMSAYALLASNPDPSRSQIERAISGNLCRCTGYVKIVDAIEKASA